MKITTSNPIIINGQRINKDRFSSIDGGSGSSKIKAFQIYANSKGWTPTLSTDGVWGAKTAAAAVTHGAKFDKVDSFTLGAPSPTLPLPNTTTPTAAAIEANKKKGVIWDKTKGWIDKGKESGVFDLFGSLFPKAETTTTTDVAPTEEKSKVGKYVLLGVGALVLIGGIYFLTKKK